MFGLKEYTAVKSLDEGYDLLMQDKKNVILGGLLWMKMGKKQYHTGIDLTGLGLNRIIETDTSIELGCMTTLRQMETSPLLEKWFGSIFKKAFEHIVGIQFRNLATIGGSISARFGFSDAATALMALDPEVQSYHGGLVPLGKFLGSPRKKDILIKIIIPKRKWKTSYQTLRKSATDFPILSIATSLCDDKWNISTGARPGKAELAKKSAGLLTQNPDEDQINAACDLVIRELSFGTDQRGSRTYREILAKVLVKRGITAICR